MHTRESDRLLRQVQRLLSSRRNWLKALALAIPFSVTGRRALPSLFAQVKNKKATALEPSVQLHIYVDVKPGKGSELENLYHAAYVPAIKVQDGFLWSRLLRHYDSTSKYEIDISFKTEKQRAAWAQSNEHQAAWPKIEEVGAKITWQGFDQLA
jgi:heme-degrading monooxygenase HmoA